MNSWRSVPERIGAVSPAACATSWNSQRAGPAAPPSPALSPQAASARRTTTGKRRNREGIREYTDLERRPPAGTQPASFDPRLLSGLGLGTAALQPLER